MILPIGEQKTEIDRYKPAHGGRGFTLIELILVMALLAVIISLAAPQLSHFFHGRTLENEAGRVLALIRYAQNEAVSRGTPVEVWFDVNNRRYGLRNAAGYNYSTNLIREFEMAEQLDIEIPGKTTAKKTGTLTTLRFEPEGTLNTENLITILIRDSRNDAIMIAPTPNRTAYEIINDINNAAGRLE